MPPIATKVPVIEAVNTNIKFSKSTMVFSHHFFWHISIADENEVVPEGEYYGDEAPAPNAGDGDPDGLAPREDILELAESEGVDSIKIEKSIDRLLQYGIISEARKGKYKLIDDELL